MLYAFVELLVVVLFPAFVGSIVGASVLVSVMLASNVVGTTVTFSLVGAMVSISPGAIVGGAVVTFASTIVDGLVVAFDIVSLPLSAVSFRGKVGANVAFETAVELSASCVGANEMVIFFAVGAAVLCTATPGCVVGDDVGCNVAAAAVATGALVSMSKTFGATGEESVGEGELVGGDGAVFPLSSSPEFIRKTIKTPTRTTEKNRQSIILATRPPPSPDDLLPNNLEVRSLFVARYASGEGRSPTP